MPSDFKNIDIIPALESVVTNIQTASVPYFRYGHIKEIQNLLSKKRNAKYPLVILRLDAPATYSTGTFKYMNYQNVTLYIVSWTKKNYVAEQRKTLVFDAVLNPIYENMINELKNNPYFDHSNMIPYVNHTKIDRYFWGSELSPQPTESVLGDPLDCIELNFPSLLVKNLNC